MSDETVENDAKKQADEYAKPGNPSENRAKMDKKEKDGEYDDIEYGEKSKKLTAKEKDEAKKSMGADKRPKAKR